LLKDNPKNENEKKVERNIKIRHSGSEKHIMGNFGGGVGVKTGSGTGTKPGGYVEEIDKSLDRLESSYCDRSYSNLLKSQMSKGYSEMQDLEESKTIENRGLRKNILKKEATQFQSFNRLLDEEDDTSIDKSELSDSFSSKSIGLTSEEEEELEKKNAKKKKTESKNRINLSISNLNSKEESKK